MDNRKNKIKGMGLSIATGVLGAGVMASPVNVLAEEAKEKLIQSQDGETHYGFGYKKSETEGVERGDSVYALRLKKGLTDTGAEFDPTSEQIKEATEVFTAGGSEERRTHVKYDGLYEFVNLQREPGFYPRLEDTMHKVGDEGLFEFPKDGGYLSEQKVTAKEEQLLEKLELILRNPKNAGIAGDFEIVKTHEPASVYGKYFDENELFFNLDEAEAKAYNNPESKENAHRVKEWKEIEEDEIFGEFKVRSGESIDWKIDGDKDKKVHYAQRLGKDIEEGIYTIRQTASETGYLKRAEDVHFVVTLKEDAEPVLEFMDDKEFKQLHELEYFKYGTHKDGGESLYQTLLVNFPIPGVNPVDPVDPDDPNKPGGRDPNEPGYENAFDKKGLRTEERKKELDEKKVYPEGEDVVVGDHIKVNVGEMFGLSFDMRIPENFDNYEYIDFVDPLDDKIILTDNTEVSVKLGDEDITNLVEIVQSKKDGEKYILVKFTPEEAEGKVEELSGANVRIEVNGIYLKEGAREDIKNRAYLYYETKDGEKVPTPEDPSEHPDPKDVIDPEKPGNPLEEDPNDPNSFDPDDPTKPGRPTIPTTPEITIDPITVDFRMGVVDQGTNLLKNAEYEIRDFIPSRGKGGINEKGNLYIGDVEFDINKLINDTAVKENGFVKLANLPAGKYTMVETVAPKGKVEGNTDEDYRLVTHELVFHVNENEQEVYIEGPIVKNKSELTDSVINVEELYRKDGSVELNEENWNHDEVHEGEAMLHHYRYINTPETGTLAGVPFFLGGGVLVSAGIVANKKKKEEKED